MRVAGLVLTLLALAASAVIAVVTRGHVFLVFAPLLVLPLAWAGGRRG